MLEIMKVLVNIPYWWWVGIALGVLVAFGSFIFGYKEALIRTSEVSTELTKASESVTKVSEGVVKQYQQARNNSNLILLHKEVMNNNLDLMLKNIGSDSALIYEIRFISNEIHITRGTCSYLPATEYQLFIALGGNQYQVSELVKRISVRVSQLINAGEADRIVISFKAKKDPCIYIDIEGVVEITYDTQKVLVINNVSMSL